MTSYTDALDAANLLRANLFDSVMRVEIAGTLRRVHSFVEAGGAVEDWNFPYIEMVAISNIGRNRAPTRADPYAVTEIDFLRERLGRLGYAAIWHEEAVEFYAPLPAESGWIPCRVWLATVESFGAVMFVHTGTAEAVERVLRPESEGGWLLEGLYVSENGLQDSLNQIVTLTEEQFFKCAFEREIVPPHERARMGIDG